MKNANNHKPEMVIDIGKAANFTGGLEFSNLTYTVIKKRKDINGKWIKHGADLLHDITGYAPKGCITAVMGPSGAGKSTFLDGLAGRIASGSLMGRVSLDGVDVNPSLIKRTSAYIMQDDRLFPMLTVYETLMFAADFRLGSISRNEKRERVERLIEQLGLTTSMSTYIGDEGTRGISGGERRRVSIGVDIIHGPSLLFLDEPTSGLDSTSAHSVIEKVHDIARSGSTVILTIHQPSSRIQLLLDHLIILARGQLMYQGSPKDVNLHLGRMGRKIPKGENPIEYFIDVVQEYDQSELGVEVLAEFALTGVKPPLLVDSEDTSVSTVAPTLPLPPIQSTNQRAAGEGGYRSNNRYRLQAVHKNEKDFDHSVKSQSQQSISWSINQSMTFTPTRNHADHRALTRRSPSQGYYTYSSDILQGTPTPVWEIQSEWRPRPPSQLFFAVKRTPPPGYARCTSKKRSHGTRGFLSSPIVKRHDAVTLLTADGITITVSGHLNRSRTLNNGFPLKVCNDFVFGFPYYWEEFASVSFDRLETTSENSENVSLDAFPITILRDLFIGNLGHHGSNLVSTNIFDDVLQSTSAGTSSGDGELGSKKASPFNIKSTVSTLDEASLNHVRSKAQRKHRGRKRAFIGGRGSKVKQRPMQENNDIADTGVLTIGPITRSRSRLMTTA
ncbi:ABC transporter G family member 17-like [Dorcoceras hygrometricum]|uniref:ABC transporter G family member STR2 n=1 Tax=Dorcoceras hygrometricum TaxID=472368 RepID=A0A2Z7AVF9_9LAMI|nr:ABC transporter G family member 17-like [Dorcoceras hygrometricum]